MEQTTIVSSVLVSLFIGHEVLFIHRGAQLILSAETLRPENENPPPPDQFMRVPENQMSDCVLYTESVKPVVVGVGKFAEPGSVIQDSCVNKGQNYNEATTVNTLASEKSPMSVKAGIIGKELNFILI